MEDNHLEHMWNEYTKTVVSYAEVMFKTKVKPFCESRGWAFVIINGIWYAGPLRETFWNWWEHKDNKEWQEIVFLLMTEVPGMDCNGLGSLMPEYNRSERIS